MNYTINIDTRTLDSANITSITDFRYTLLSKLKNVISIKMTSFEFTNSSYLFTATKGNNFFNITYSSTQYTFTIPDGNYSAENIVTKINDWLVSNIPAISVALDINSGKLKFTSTASDFSINFPSNANYKSFGQLIGFGYVDYTSTSNILKADNIINVIGENYYFLKINDYGHIYNGSRKYMSKIILNAPKYQVVYEDSQFYVSKLHIFNQTIDVKYLDIQLYDYKGNIVNPNGIDFSFSIEFKMIQNTVLKMYKNLNFRSNELDELILKDKILKYCMEKT